MVGERPSKLRKEPGAARAHRWLKGDGRISSDRRTLTPAPRIKCGAGFSQREREMARVVLHLCRLGFGIVTAIVIVVVVFVEVGLDHGDDGAIFDEADQGDAEDEEAHGGDGDEGLGDGVD